MLDRFRYNFFCVLCLTAFFAIFIIPPIIVGIVGIVRKNQHNYETSFLEKTFCYVLDQNFTEHNCNPSCRKSCITCYDEQFTVIYSIFNATQLKNTIIINNTIIPSIYTVGDNDTCYYDRRQVTLVYWSRPVVIVGWAMIVAGFTITGIAFAIWICLVCLGYCYCHGAVKDHQENETIRLTPSAIK